MLKNADWFKEFTCKLLLVQTNAANRLASMFWFMGNAWGLAPCTVLLVATPATRYWLVRGMRCCLGSGGLVTCHLGAWGLASCTVFLVVAPAPRCWLVRGIRCCLCGGGMATFPLPVGVWGLSSCPVLLVAAIERAQACSERLLCTESCMLLGLLSGLRLLSFDKVRPELGCGERERMV